jgi:hypothetical protein
VGRDGHSWEVDGKNKCTGHKGKLGEYKCDQWKSSDILGLACDLEKMQIHVSLNGSFAAPHGVVFVPAPDSVGDGLLVAFSGYSGKVCYNLGEAAFRHTRRRPRTSRRMPHLRARPFSVPASYSGDASWSACALRDGGYAGGEDRRRGLRRIN